MTDLWKNIICSTRECMAASLNDNGSVKEMGRIFPEIDTPELVKFVCPRCGYTESWEEQRQQVARVLYERLSHAGLGSKLA